MEWRRVAVGGGWPKRNSHCAVVNGSVLYIYGGYNGTIMGDMIAVDLEVARDSFYCPTVDSCFPSFSELPWREVIQNPAPPEPRHSASAVVHNGNMIVFGGATSSGLSNQLLFFNFSTHTWKEVRATSEFPSPRCGHVAAIHEGKMIIHGGFTDDSEPGHHDDDLWVIHLDSLHWEHRKLINEYSYEDLPPCPHFHSAVVVRNQLHVLAGKVRPLAHYTSPFYSIDIPTSKVEVHRMPPRPQATLFGHSVSLVDNRLVVIGGFNTLQKNSVSTASALDLNTERWKELMCIGDNTPIYLHTATPWKGRILIFGGITAEFSEPSVWCCTFTGGELDKLSSLPDSLIVNIMYFLPLRDIVVNFSKVNTRIHHLCWSGRVTKKLALSNKFPFQESYSLKTALQQSMAFTDSHSQSFCYSDAHSFSERFHCLAINICGLPGIGKKTLVESATKQKVDGSAVPNFSSEGNRKEKVPVHVLDFDSAAQNQVQRAHAYIVCYSVEELSSFTEAQKFMSILRRKFGCAMPVVLCGCKADLQYRQVSPFDGTLLARQHLVPFLETSGNRTLNTKKVFEQALRAWSRVHSLMQNTLPQSHPAPSGCNLM
ncbi:hypothetical protein Pelo_10900 [Pelomyxa schiedti]|nr:hypothetical protein Pelo_10900 [Pelomyxa schiedti]